MMLRPVFLRRTYYDRLFYLAFTLFGIVSWILLALLVVIM